MKNKSYFIAVVLGLIGALYADKIDTLDNLEKLLDNEALIACFFNNVPDNKSCLESVEVEDGDKKNAEVLAGSLSKTP